MDSRTIWMIFGVVVAGCALGVLAVLLRRLRSLLVYYWRLWMDPFNLHRYAKENAELAAVGEGERRVVFFGDSITEEWQLDRYFPGKPYVNRGISAETTPQMMVRFHQDVIALRPAVVVILAGINDMGPRFGRATVEQTADNLAAMAEMAGANEINVVMCSLLPNGLPDSERWKTRVGKVEQLNTWIREYASRHGYAFVDYFPALKDANGAMPIEQAPDGVHPGPKGYEIMTPLVEAGIEKALKAGNRE
jgi:lysophospholipase L1-like esterase